MDMLVKCYSKCVISCSKASVALLLLGSLLLGSNSVLAEAMTVNINTASASELSTELLGVGDSKSMAIVKNRETLGDFKTPMEITRVKGIGDVIYTNNKERIVVK